MAVESSPFAIQANSYSAEVLRRAVYFLLTRGSSIGSVAGGVVNLAASDCIMSAPVSGLSVNNATGEAIVPGSSTTTQSGYYFRISSTTSTSIAAADPSNPRIDGVYLVVQDAAYTGSNNQGLISVVTGTPTAGATLSNLNGKGAAPTSSLLIGYVLVPAGATNIITADLGDHRAQVTLASGLTAGGVTSATAGQAIGLSATTGTVTISLVGVENVTTTASSGTYYSMAPLTTTIGNDITLSGSAWIQLPTAQTGGFCWAYVRQPGSGTSTWTGTFTTATTGTLGNVKWAGGTRPTFSTGTSAYDWYAFQANGTAGWTGITIGQNFS